MSSYGVGSTIRCYRISKPNGTGFDWDNITMGETCLITHRNNVAPSWFATTGLVYYVNFIGLTQNIDFRLPLSGVTYPQLQISTQLTFAEYDPATSTSDSIKLSYAPWVRPNDANTVSLSCYNGNSTSSRLLFIDLIVYKLY